MVYAEAAAKGKVFGNLDQIVCVCLHVFECCACICLNVLDLEVKLHTAQVSFKNCLVSMKLKKMSAC